MKRILALTSLSLLLFSSCGSTTTKNIAKDAENDNNKITKKEVVTPKAAPVKKVTKTESNSPINWVTDINQAFSMAEKENKPVFVFFTGKDWCGWCKKLVAQVFHQKEFVEYANKEYIMLELDFPRRDRSKITPQMVQMSQQLGVRGYPSVFVISPKKEVLGRTGYQRMNAAQYIEHLEAFRNK